MLGNGDQVRAAAVLAAVTGDLTCEGRFNEFDIHRRKIPNCRQLVQGNLFTSGV